MPPFDPKARIIVTQGLEDSGFISPALVATARQFIGPGRAPPTAGGGAGGAAPSPRALIRPDMLSPGSNTPYRQEQSEARSVGLRVVQPLHGKATATGRQSIGRGKTLYALPEGLGVLRDPAMIRFDTDFTEAEAGLAWKTPLSDRVVVEAEVAVGIRETETQTHVTSALLDVRNTSRQSSGFVVLRNGIDLSPANSGGPIVHLGAEARIFPGESITLRQTLSLRF